MFKFSLLVLNCIVHDREKLTYLKQLPFMSAWGTKKRRERGKQPNRGIIPESKRSKGQKLRCSRRGIMPEPITGQNGIVHEREKKRIRTGEGRGA